MREIQPLLRVGVRQQDAKIVAREARQHGAARQIVVEHSGEAHDDLVASAASESVIDELQIIEVEIDDLVRVVIGFEAFPCFVHLCLEARSVHQPGHGVERLFDHVFDLAHDVRHEPPVCRRERLVADATEQREHTFDIALLVHDGTEQRLVTQVGDRLSALDRGNLEDGGRPLALEPGQHLIDQVAIQHPAIDVFPARMGRTDANALRGHQQDAVGDAEEAAALADELRQARVAARLTVDLLVDLVDELEFFLHVPGLGASVLQLVVDAQALGDDRHSRFEDVPEEARIEPGRLTGIA